MSIKDIKYLIKEFPNGKFYLKGNNLYVNVFRQTINVGDVSNINITELNSIIRKG